MIENLPQAVSEHYAPIVALAVSLQGPFWPDVLTQLSTEWAVLLASGSEKSVVCGVYVSTERNVS